MKKLTLGGLLVAAMQARIAKAGWLPSRFATRAAPRRRLQWPQMNETSIASYDRAMSNWLAGGREGPRPTRFVEPKARRMA